jgi:hypothetical protein
MKALEEFRKYENKSTPQIVVLGREDRCKDYLQVEEKVVVLYL